MSIYEFLESLQKCKSNNIVIRVNDYIQNSSAGSVAYVGEAKKIPICLLSKEIVYWSFNFNNDLRITIEFKKRGGK